jgi:hypothetical protein
VRNESAEGIVAVAEISGPTIQDEALLEAGKKLLLNSIDDSRSYCQEMITKATGAIPVYIAILKLWFPSENAAPGAVSALFAAPAFLFLLAALSFSLGYLPLQYEMNIGNLDSIEEVRLRLMRHRATWGLMGLALFSLGIVIAVIYILFAA